MPIYKDKGNESFYHAKGITTNQTSIIIYLFGYGLIVALHEVATHSCPAGY